MGIVQPSLHCKYMQHLVLYTVCLFMSLHGPAGACIMVASVSPIQCCGMHIYMIGHDNWYTVNIVLNGTS